MAVDFQIFGVESVLKKFETLRKSVRKDLLRAGLERWATVVRDDVLARVGGGDLNVVTGAYLAAWSKQPVVFQRGGMEGMPSAGIAFPSREALGISKDDENYYPFAIEYGHAAPLRGRKGKKLRRAALTAEAKTQAKQLLSGGGLNKNLAKRLKKMVAAKSIAGSSALKGLAKDTAKSHLDVSELRRTLGKLKSVSAKSTEKRTPAHSHVRTAVDITGRTIWPYISGAMARDVENLFAKTA